MPKKPKPAFDFSHYEMDPIQTWDKELRLFATDSESAPDGVTIMVDHDDTDHPLSEALAQRIQLLPSLIDLVEGMANEDVDMDVLEGVAKRLSEIDAELTRKRAERDAEDEE